VIDFLVLRRQLLNELLPANLVPMLEAEEWKQVSHHSSLQHIYMALS